MENAAITVLENPSQTRSSFHLVNSYSIALAHQDSLYRATLQEGVCFPDGKPLSLFAKLKNPSTSQIRGPSMFEKVLENSGRIGTKHFFLGGSEELLDALLTRITKAFPNTEISGSFSPPFRKMTPEEVSAQDSLILESKADIVWVGLGTPRQDFECARITKELGLTTVAVGAAFDFFSGLKKESQKWMTKLGLEWIFRFASEPKRLWRRYLVGNFVFLWAVLLGWSKS
jgi:N-acetylglucosaminyldiphosphoundecaprenol N-acetyl-beta-D-mannosaminyltransferase